MSTTNFFSCTIACLTYMEFRIFHIHKRKTSTQFSIFPWQWSIKTINLLRFVAWTIVILVPPFVSIYVEQKKDSASLASRNCACQKTDDCPASGPSCLATRHFPSLIFANAWANIIGSPLEIASNNSFLQTLSGPAPPVSPKPLPKVVLRRIRYDRAYCDNQRENNTIALTFRPAWKT